MTAPVPAPAPTHLTTRVPSSLAPRVPSAQSTRVPSPLIRAPQPLLREVYGRLLRRLRQRQGRTLAEVAGDAGVSVAYLSEIERGLKEPSSEILAAVCTALDAELVHLVGAAHEDLRELSSTALAEARVLDLASRRTSSVDRHVRSGRQPLSGPSAGLSLLAA